MFEYTIDKNSEIAKNLKGHRMLPTGDIDNNVHPCQYDSAHLGCADQG